MGVQKVQSYLFSQYSKIMGQKDCFNLVELWEPKRDSFVLNHDKSGIGNFLFWKWFMSTQNDIIL